MGIPTDDLWPATTSSAPAAGLTDYIRQERLPADPLPRMPAANMIGALLRKPTGLPVVHHRPQ